MKRLFDTSVLVAAMVESHPAHESALTCLRRVVQGVDEGFVATHTLAELYSVLTTLPVQPRVSPSGAVRLTDANVLQKCHVVDLDAADYVTVIHRLGQNDIRGGVVYDALMMQAAEKADVEEVVTLNPGDFRRVDPLQGEKVRQP